MPTATTGFAGARSSTGLVITVAIHAALGAALLSLGIVGGTAPTIVEPMKIRNIPDATPEALPPPQVPDHVIEPLVTAPPLDIAPDLPPVPPTGLTMAVNPPLPGPVDLAGPGATPDANPPVPVSLSARLDPRFASRFQPPYPAASERAEEEGVVLVRVRVGSDGRVLAAEVKGTSGHRRLDAAAVDHARRAWRFVPATRDGVAVESWREIPVRFEIVNG